MLHLKFQWVINTMKKNVATSKQHNLFNKMCIVIIPYFVHILSQLEKANGIIFSEFFN